MTVSTGGGLIGVAIGAAITFVVAFFAHWPIILSPGAAIASVVSPRSPVCSMRFNLSNPPGVIDSVDPALGLTTDEARRRLQAGGSNVVADVREHPIKRALGKLWAPVPWMLEAAIGLALLLGDDAQAGAVAVLLVFNAGLSYFQESRSQATLDALKSRLALVSPVRRDGTWVTVRAAELVPGDVIKLSLGAVVGADVRILDGLVLLDQSMLTGESLPVEAGAGTDAYAGGLIRRGEARATVTATGERTKFGRSAELIRTASVESSEQKAILLVVRNLVLFNGGVTVLLAAYALLSPMPRGAIAPLILVAILASIPVALPSMFTLAAAIGARSLARRGVLPTRLSAVDEAAGIDILCCDKTGTLTRNELAVTSVRPLPGFAAANVLGLAALASSDGGQDPVDAAIRAASARTPGAAQPALVTFVPFDPALKRSEATVRDANGAACVWRKALTARSPGWRRHRPLRRRSSPNSNRRACASSPLRPGRLAASSSPA